MIKKGIGKINYSEVYIYYPLQYESKHNFNKIIELLTKSSICSTNDYFNCLNAAFVDKISNDLDNTIKEINEKQNDVKFMLPKNCKKSNANKVCLSLKDKLVSDSCCVCNDGIYIDSSLSNEITFKTNLIERNQETSNRIVGNLYNDIQKRILLLPIEITFVNGTSQTVIPELILFTNSIIFIKLNITFCNIDVEHYFEDYINNSISHIEILDLNKIETKSTIEDAIDYYINKMCNDSIIDKYIKGTEFKNIELIDYEGMPVNFENVNKYFKRDCYFITSAPVPNRNEIDFTNKATNYYDKQSENMNNQICYILKTNGGCLSLNSSTMLKIALDKFDDLGKEIKLKYIAEDISINTEFAILINMMNHLNDNIYFLDRLNKSKLQSKKKKYYQNKILINQLMRYCYGSVVNQVDSFAKKMYLYHNTEIYKEKSISIDKLIELDETEKNKAFQNYISLMGVLLVILLGLPSIYETLVLLKEILPKIDYIPWLNLSQFSVVIWVTSIIFSIVVNCYFTKNR